MSTFDSVALSRDISMRSRLERQIAEQCLASARQRLFRRRICIRPNWNMPELQVAMHKQMLDVLKVIRPHASADLQAAIDQATRRDASSLGARPAIADEVWFKKHRQASADDHEIERAQLHRELTTTVNEAAARSVAQGSFRRRPEVPRIPRRHVH